MTASNINIPPEALEAAAKAIYEHWQFAAQVGPKAPPWVSGGNSLKQDEARAYARAACLAMLEAWPGMEKDYYYYNGAIILPLTESEDE